MTKKGLRYNLPTCQISDKPCPDGGLQCASTLSSKKRVQFDDNVEIRVYEPHDDVA